MLNFVICKSDPSIYQYSRTISETCNECQEKLAKLLNINQAIDVIIMNDGMDHRRLGVGGYTPSQNLVQVFLNPVSTSTNDIHDDLLATIAHEVYHAKCYADHNYNYNLNRTTLLEYLIFEGLGAAFEEQVVGGPTKLTQSIDDTEIARKIIGQIEPFYNLDYWEDRGRNGYDLNGHWFVQGDNKYGLPYNAGYMAGYYLVKQYLHKTGLEPSSLTKAEPDNFIK